MTRLSLIITTTLFSTLLSTSLAEAGRAPPNPDGSYDEVPLAPDELREISLLVLAANPKLSSSPGIKFAEAYRVDADTKEAHVIWYPHEESAGMKTAFQVACEQKAGYPWACEDATPRRYLAIESQEFEVRVVAAEIDYLEAIAVVEATRASIPKIASDRDTVYTAIILRASENGYKVAWHGEETGDEHLILEAIPVDGGDTRSVSGWHVTKWEYPGCLRIPEGTGYRMVGAGC